MKFIIDAQLPPALAAWLIKSGHDATHVKDLNLRDSTDTAIWRYALQTEAIIITKDEDFPKRASQSRQRPCIVWIRVGNCTSRALLHWFSPLFPAIIREITEGQQLIEVR